MKSWILKTIGFIHGGVLMTSICTNVILALIIALMYGDKKKKRIRGAVIADIIMERNDIFKSFRQKCLGL